MLSKLMKHELRATGRSMLPFLGAMLVLGILTRPAMLLMDRVNGGLPDFLLGLIVGLFFGTVGASGLVVFIMSIDRFHKNLLGTEGYLMLTLPATRSQHILAKLFTSLIWYAATGMIGLVSLALAFLDNHYLVRFFSRLPSFAEISEILSEHGSDVAQLLGGAVELFVIGVLALAVLTVLFYAADALGSAFRKSNTLLRCVFVIAFLWFTMMAAIFVIGRIFPLNGIFTDDGPRMLLVCGGIGIVCELAVGAVYFFLARYLLTNKLNLE